MSKLRLVGGTISDLRASGKLQPSWKVKPIGKRCRWCGETKPHDQFWKMAPNPEGSQLKGGGRPMATCKTCRSLKAPATRDHARRATIDKQVQGKAVRQHEQRQL